ncbi:putative porin [Emticicia sp. W12TSBA100-4]|uniref:putative porin n=1 Tax=Emticicia sp. W12TSBA100-4 TaxID=3160965 RepID=UPI003305A09C
MNKKHIFITFLLSVIYGFSYAQILDDSTKQVYSTKTVKYILEDDILNNRKTFYNPDTTLANFHLFDFNLRSGQLYQDLGNLGTAIKPLFFTPTTDIAKNLGYSTYGAYAFDVRKTTYFNTKSPYTNVNYVQSGGGAAIMHFTHSQNIKPRLNATLDVRRMSSSKQYGAPQTREERLVDSWAAMLHANYESKNEKYIVLGSYNHFNHAPLEQGGIQPLGDSTAFVAESSLGNYRDFLSKLTGAASRDWRNELHVYHQYKLTNGFQVYHILDYQKRRDLYTDIRFGADSSEKAGFYQVIPKSVKDTLSMDLRYNLLENKFGIKGIYKGFAYRLYLRQRFYSMRSDSGNYLPNKINTETLVGGWANYFFPDSVRRVYAEAELGAVNTLGNLRLQAEYLSPRIKAGVTILRVPPNILDEKFTSVAYDWNKKLAKTFTTNLYASTSLQKGNFVLSPSAYNSLITNYIYYDTKAQVRQDSSAINIFRVGLGVEYRWKRLLIANQSYYTANTAENRLPTPKFANNTTISYEFIYAKVLRINAGVEIYYRSAYFANNFMPLTRQFFLQDQQKVWGTPVADVFADLKINKVRLFFKFAHVNQGFPSNGYYVSSTYPGLRRTFFLGVNWPLFD